MIKLEKEYENKYAIKFCKDFINSSLPKYIFGRNEWAKNIANLVDIDGFIDDFTKDENYLNKPIVPISEIPNNALVVVVVIGKPLIAEKRVKAFQFKSIDYYSFYKYSNLPIKQIMFWDGFIEDFKRNRKKYEWIYEKLNDNISKNQFYNIINFRLSYNLNFMRGFSAIEDKQYFEKFLNLNENKEIFVDIGAYDGFTSEEFIKKVPVTWDKTKVLNAKIGEYLTVARKNGNKWFIGSMTGDRPQSFQIDLDFLNDEKTYKATIYYDDKDAKQGEWTPVKTEEKILAKTDLLGIDLAKSGGCVIVLEPYKGN